MQTTGWPPGMLQDDSRELSRWLSTRLGARHQIQRNNMQTNQTPEALAEDIRAAVVELADGRRFPDLIDAITRLRDMAVSGARDAEAPTVEEAHQMGATGGPTVEAERLAFEAWMRGHCWALSAKWIGTQYRSDAEEGGRLDPLAMATRRLWAAWRDRAALAATKRGGV